MNSKSNHIILINFDFPPNYGIGGRRWGKFAKELATLKIHVHVIKAEKKDNRNSHWTKDVDSEFIHVYELKRKAELDRWRVGIGILDKITYKIALAFNKWLDKGTPFDLAIGCQSQINQYLDKITSQFPIEWIIATGAPFNLTYFAAEYVKHSQKLKLWVDLRDPWLDAQNYGMLGLSEKRKKAEEAKALSVITNSSVVSCPTIDALQIFKTITSQNIDHKLFELRHFYDPSDYVKTSLERPKNKIKIVYGGDIYIDSEKHIHKLVSDLKSLQQTHPLVYQMLDFRFFSDTIFKVKNLFENLEVIRLEKSIGNRIFEEISSCDWCMILLSDFNKNFFTTKYFEYQPYNKPYLYLGPNGMVFNEISKEGIGMDWSQFYKNLTTNDPLELKSFVPKQASRKGSIQERTKDLLERMGYASNSNL
jgi:glycosyltransferase involved in cell wall biosynthesis